MLRTRARRLWAFAPILGALLALAAAGEAARTASADGDAAWPITHEEWSSLDALSADYDGTLGTGAATRVGSTLCSTATSEAANVNTDCAETGVTAGVHNETSIAVNPTNALNMIAGANDYQITVSNGGTLNEAVLSRAHVTFDGGKTWTTYPLDDNSYGDTGDPAVAFDAGGRAYYATLADVQGQGAPTFTNPDILVNTSSDGGRTWSGTVVAKGSGSAGSVGNFLDKEYVAAWGHGNAIVTFTDFRDGIGGSYGGSPIMASVTHDGGKTWSAPQVISGSAPFCLGFGGGTACDQDQGSIPVVAADGSIYVTFFSTADTTLFRDQYIVVKVDPTKGQRIAGPFRVGGVFDGITDYPVSVDGRPTYQDSEFRTWAAGNIAADPANARHLAVIWSDMRNSQLPAPADPYQAKTNSDVIVSQSTDGGATWSAPVAIRVAGDQFMPWGAYGSDGRLRIGYFDRSYDSANHKYGYTLATERRSGSLTFSTTQVTNALSDPTHGDRWFSGSTASLGYPTRFLGDYSGLSADGTAATWTDLRNPVNFGGRSGTTEDMYYASIR